jgi:hypothetical protein
MPIFTDVERDGSVLVREIETAQAGAFLAAIVEVAGRLRAVIRQLELRPRRDTLDARIVVAPDREGGNGSAQLALADALLADLRFRSAAPA